MTDNLNILLVEHSADETVRIRGYLQSAAGAFDLRTAHDLGEAINLLEQHSFDVILLDLALPGSAGLPALARLTLASGRIPVVVLTGTDDEAIGLRAVQAGAEDYLLKGQLHGTLLWRALRHAVERNRAANRIEFQSQLLDQVGQAVIATDTTGTIQYWNAAAQALFGWAAEEVIGKPLRSIIPADEDGAAAIRSASESWTGEVVVQRRDGRRILVGATLSTLRDSSGEVIGRIGISTDVTERRAAENALRESEQRLRLFVDTMPTIVWTTGTDLRITSIRGAGLRGLAGVAESAIGRHISEFAMSPDLVRSSEVLAGEAVSAAVEWNGHAFDVHIEPLRDPHGVITGTIGIALDVTERRRSELEAAQYFELLRTVIDAAPLAIVVIDEEARVSLWNRAAERMFGWRSSEVIGHPVPYVPQEERGRFDQARARVSSGGGPEKLTGKRATKDGHMIDVVVTAAPVLGADGRYHGTMGIMEDVTQQRLSAELQERLTAIIEASPDFVATFDVERRTLFINRAGRALVGLAADQDLTATTLEQFCTPDTAEELHLGALPRALQEGTWSGEARLRTVANDDVLVWLTLVAHRRAGGDLAFISAVAQDMSERRFLEEQLRQSQKMEAVGRLAGGVAHDFNNLLTAIAGHTELLLEDLGEDDAIRSDIEEILRAVDRASNLTRQLLAFSRRQVLQPRLLDVNQVITDLGTLLRRLIGEDVTLSVSLDSGLPTIRADRGQIEQVVMNLIVNARDALPHGGEVRLATKALEVEDDSLEHRRGVSPGTYIQIAVSDNGVGMDEAVMTRIFEPFFTTKEQGKGTGLGLPTAHGIVSQSGGRILADSELGSGSTFRVLLPKAAGVVEDEVPDAAIQKDASGTETVLLVEDEHAVRRLGCRILERKGYNVVEADSGSAAIRLFEHMAPVITLLVTDVVMPGMSGSELARRLRDMKPTLRVLFTSGYTADAIERHGGFEPGTAFLEKPFTPDALARKVREVLDDRNC
ncbi:MAG TPA: PAS domain S-box protein [Longimicrobiales bacterium]|nr:PAS domain S-box protein [Longimicrobiales bacterium]